VSTGTARVYDLAAARPDGWLDKVLEQSPDFERACRIIGRSTLGLGLVAGARISSLTPSTHGPRHTLVEFSIGPNPSERQVSLGEFRETIARYLLAPLKTPSLPNDPDVEALQAHIGGRYMLEACLFEVRPLQLRHELGLSEIALEFNEVRHVLTLEDFRDIIDERVRAELGIGGTEDEVAIDLSLVDQAVEANAEGKWSATVALLTPWVTPISMLLRTGEKEELNQDVRERLSEGLDLLGTAFAKLGDLESANEVLRLGVQWAGESSKAADLYLTLGRASAAADRHGEAIGLLRRAVRLGSNQAEAMPLLARSLSSREQNLAAMVCVRRAKALGAEDEIAELGSAVEARLGEPWSRFAQWMWGAD
jgi:tetratricopeptide (TPR) repeat protein